MITTEYIGFFASLLTSILGMAIVFLALIFLALFVMIVSRAIKALEKKLASQAGETENTVPARMSPKRDNKEVLKIAVITTAISEERREPVDKFVITKIQKI